ncbi:hypothetical protein E3Q10_00588 [Wallemia mellicola]|uniref:Prolyl endopeptidase n=1 Tax=Wallemia mellicola TaxID=1708541 RepID=A0A4T0MU65_9BASI|nr:hypothetical protein E3Q19_03734 [Wallemia mellicola]TIC33850.1 hypothetical protein E3Q10_00588 [Wallemia mellicola]
MIRPSRLLYTTRNIQNIHKMAFNYPNVRRDETKFTDYKSEKRGVVRVPDPYHWLETPPAQSKESAEFVDAQNNLFNAYMEDVKYKEEFKTALTQNMSYPKFSAPSLKKNGIAYWSENAGLQPHAVIRSSKQLSSNESNVFFDPNQLSDDKTASLATAAFSKTAKYFGYGISRSGSDWCTLYVRPSDSPFTEKSGSHETDKERFSDEIRYVKFSSIGWLGDSGFFYQRYDVTEGAHGAAHEDVAGLETDANENAKLYYHKVNTPQSEDKLVLEDPQNPTHMWSASTTDDGRFLVVTVAKDTSRRNLLKVADLNDSRNAEISSNMCWLDIISDFKHEYDVIDNDDSKLYIHTNEEADNYKIKTFDIASNVWSELVSEEDGVLVEAQIVNSDKLVAVYTRDVKSELIVRSLRDGSHLYRPFDKFTGSINQVTGERDHTKIYLSTTSYTTPGEVLCFDFEELEKRKCIDQASTVFRSAEVNGLDPKEFTTEQHFAQSPDGTKIPVFITRHKDTPKDAPFFLYGYGGFSISLLPFFSPSALTFVKHFRAGLAVANIRGGGEYGESWHQAGTKERKQNCFDDFLASANYLVDNGFARKGSIIANGGSNGGLLAAVVAQQDKMDLIGVSIVDVGVLDMLKFHLWTIGRAWCSDYGNAEEANDFDYLYEYSPLHQAALAQEKIYPSMLLTSAAHDDRVVSCHTTKMIAQLQHTQSEKIKLARLETKAGHGAGKSTEMRIAEATDKYTFAAHELGLKWFN